MSSLKDVFRALIDMRDCGIITDYAIGGATAFLFYVEPTRTYDVDVFVRLPSGVRTTGLASLSPLYEWAANRGIAVQGEHLMIESVPVQPLVAYNSLVEEAIDNARLYDYAGGNCCNRTRWTVRAACDSRQAWRICGNTGRCLNPTQRQQRHCSSASVTGTANRRNFRFPRNSGSSSNCSGRSSHCLRGNVP